MVIDLLEWRTQTQDVVTHALNTFGVAVVDNPGAAFFSTVGILAAVAAWGVVRRGKSKGEEIEMVKRRVLLDEKYADMIGDGLFDMLCRDEIDRHEYKRACRRFGMAYRLSDLIAAKNQKRGMKSRVMNNIRKTKLLDASGDPIQPRIPGPKPAEVVPVPQSKQPKRWVAKGKSLLPVKAA